jgi:hypothetical protein
MHESKAFILKKKFLIVLFVLMGYTLCFSQKKDSILPKDSLTFYKKIKKIASKYRFTKLIYNAIFVDPAPNEYPVKPGSKEGKNVNPYIKYQKRIIRKINISVFDPFGHSVTDTIIGKINYFKQTGNRVHVKTRRWIIRNRLLFKENDTLNPLALSETERIMRQAIYINDAKIFISKTNSKDSIDVNVIVIDKWPVTALPSADTRSGHITLSNSNLFGFGQQFQQYVGFKSPDIFDYSGFYNIPNIDSKFISSQLSYQINADLAQLNFNFDRPFFSPLVKWAWGTNFNNVWHYFEYTDPADSTTKRAKTDNFTYDVWAGRTFKFKKDKSFFNQSTNIIVGLRNYKNIFLQRPSFAIDKDKTNSSTTVILGNAGLAVQQYYKDKFIYRFGANEDVPEGLIAQVIYGGLKPQFSKVRYYLGGEIARAKHFKFGYLTATASFGLFFNKTVANDITTNYKLYYFSNLLKSGRWLFRQFFNYTLVHLENKLTGETLTLNTDELYGFQNQSLTGDTKMVFNSETVAYAPYNIVGFRFAPVFQVGMGMVGSPQFSIFKSRLYQGYTFGIMLRNENLLNSTFQFSVGMYPFFPDVGNYKFIYNPVVGFTLRVRAFTVSKPDFIGYH